MTLEQGTRLGPYEIVAPLGRGGMGEVYRARDRRLGREVAVKVLPRAMATEPDALVRFEREARAVAALNHPNILALHDVNLESGVWFAVTELLQGHTLGEVLATGPLAPSTAVGIAIQVARGLAAAHGRGIVHRDLTPSNIFVCDDGLVKVLDFGIARPDASQPHLAETQSLTEDGLVTGTLGYMAPEQMRGEPAVAESDVFSFGVVCYQMLTGRAPFRRHTPSETLAAVLRDDPEPVAALVPSVPPALARLVHRCLEKRAADRPGSARDLAIYLEALSGEPVAAGAARAADGPPAPEPATVRRRILAASFVLLLVVTGSTWAYVQAMGARAARAAVEADLGRAAAPVRHVYADRLARLDFTARLVSSFPELKALFGTDGATVRDFLVSYQQRNPGTPTLVALRPSGALLARTDGSAAEALPPGAAEAMRALVSPPGPPRVAHVDGRPQLVAVAASEAAGTVFGFVLALAPVDEALARQMGEATQEEVVVLGGGGPAVSTLRAGLLPWSTLEDWRAAGGGEGHALPVALGDRRFAAREVPLSADPALSAVVLKSPDAAAEPFRRIQNGLLLLGGVALALSVAGSVWLTRFVVRSLGR